MISNLKQSLTVENFIAQYGDDVHYELIVHSPEYWIICQNYRAPTGTASNRELYLFKFSEPLQARLEVFNEKKREANLTSNEEVELKCHSVCLSDRLRISTSRAIGNPRCTPFRPFRNQSYRMTKVGCTRNKLGLSQPKDAGDLPVVPAFETVEASRPSSV